MSLALATKGMIYMGGGYVLELGVNVALEEPEVKVAFDDLLVEVIADDLQAEIGIEVDGVGVIIEEPTVEVDA